MQVHDESYMKILVRLPQFLVQVTIQLVQSNLKVHQIIWAVHFLYAAVHIPSAPQLSPVFSELHLAADSISLLLLLTFSFLYPQHKVAPTMHLSSASLAVVITALSLVGYSSDSGLTQLVDVLPD